MSPIFLVPSRSININGEEKGKSRKQHFFNFDRALELGSIEKVDFLKSEKLINRFISDMELHFLIFWNFEELIGSIKNYLILLTNRENKRNILLDINRRVINVLSAERLFLDHFSSISQNSYNESIYEKFKQYTANQYDEHFAYRFTYHLRNYSIHKGLPLTKLEITSKKEGASLEVFAEKSDLLSWRNWKPDVREELSQLPDRIEIIPFLAKSCVCFEEINRNLCLDIMQFLEPNIRFLIKISDQVIFADYDRVCVFDISQDDFEEVRKSSTSQPLFKNGFRVVKLPWIQAMMKMNPDEFLAIIRSSF